MCPTLRSFCIDDILSHKTAALQRGGPPSLPGIVMFSIATSIVISIARYHNIFHQYCHKYCPPSMQGIVPQFVVFFISIVFCTRCSGYHLCYQIRNLTSWEGHFTVSNAPPPPWPPCPGMHRPWDQREGGGGGGALQQGEGGRGNKASPLDALFNMISNNDALTAKSGKLLYDISHLTQKLPGGLIKRPSTFSTLSTTPKLPIFICLYLNFCHIYKVFF